MTGFGAAFIGPNESATPRDLELEEKYIRP